MIGEPPPGARPTNDRAWPGDRIRVKRTGIPGWVVDYEYWLGGCTFPVLMDSPAGQTVMLLRSEITVVHSARGNVVTFAPSTTHPAGDAEPNTVHGAA